jgi:hypothetical protein
MNEYKPIKFTAADREWIHGDDAHDTPFRDRQSVVLIHGTSPELVVNGSRFIPNAMIGDYGVPQGDLRAVFKGSVGVVFHPIGFDHTNPEYTVGLGDDRGVFVCDHGVRAPDDTKFLYAADGIVKKSGHYRMIGGKPGNRVKPTVTAYGLVNGHGVSYAMYGTAYSVARDWVNRAERLRAKVEIDGKLEEIRGCTLGLFLLTSRLEKKGSFTYPMPVVTPVGKLGDANGPSVEQWRLAKRLRQALKQGLDWMPPEALDLPAPPEALPASPGKGSIDIRSGRGAWDNGAPPHTDYEGPDDDEITN